MEQQPSPVDHNSLYITFCTICLASITHWTANGIAAFFTIAAGATATLYNIIKTIDYLRKKKDNE